MPISEQIVAHVNRYRLTTVDVIHSVFYSGKSREAAKKAANRLVASHQLESFELGNQQKLYSLPNGTKLGSQAIWANFATLIFCNLRQPPKQRLLPREFEHFFPEISKLRGVAPAQQHYFVEMQDSSRIGRILTDSDATVERLVRKCHETIRHIKQTPGLSDMYESGLLFLAVLVAESSKVQDVRLALHSQLLSSQLEVHPLKELSKIAPL